MQQSSSIAGYLYHNYEGESFYKGQREKEIGTSINDVILLVKKPEFGPKMPK